MKVIIDPADDILYKSFYVFGLEKLFGRNNVSYNGRYFSELSVTARNTKSMRFVLVNDDRQSRYVIECNDSYKINKELYDWCDVYGSVNANFSKTPKEFHEKLVALCPSFGVRCWNVPQTVYHALCNYHGSGSGFKKFLGKHKRMLQRVAYDCYFSPIEETSSPMAENTYVFFLSTLWYSDEWNKNDEGLNARRSNFIRACKELDGVEFEGGLVSQGKDRSSEELFADCLCEGVAMKEWMEKTKRSALVFNTPAFWDCHGWKLGEYLAMGKAIVSTPLSNDLPAPLEHGKNIHFVENDKEAMKDAIQYIVTHPEYRMKLEQGAREYWDKYGTPRASLRLLGIDNGQK